MMFSCLFHRFLTVLQIIRPSFFTKKSKGTFKSHSLTCFNLSVTLTFSLFLSLSHCFSLSFSHTQTYLHICIVCLLAVLFVFICETSNNPRVFEDPSKVRGHMAGEISKALLHEAKVRQILINLLPCLWKSLLILHTICLFCCSCWSMMF